MLQVQQSLVRGPSKERKKGRKRSVIGMLKDLIINRVVAKCCGDMLHRVFLSFVSFETVISPFKELIHYL